MTDTRDEVERLRNGLMDHAPVRGHRAVREEAASMLSALRQRAEAAEASEAEWKRQAIYHNRKHGEAITEARAQVAAASTLKAMGYTYHGGVLWKPPLGDAPDFNSLDAEWNAALEAAADICSGQGVGWIKAESIRALRRSGKGE